MSDFGIKDYVPPVAGKHRVTSGQGARKARRTTNGAMMSSFHHGLDIAGATPGSKPPIRSITAGKVVFTGKAGGWGNTVIIQNPDGYLVQFGHLDSIGVKVGDQVSAGQNIGVMGASGNVTGVHLDMIVTKNGKTIKPDGGVLAPAPASIARRAKAGGATVTGATDATASSSNPFEQIQPPQAPQASLIQSVPTTGNLFTDPNTPTPEPTNVLSSPLGFVVPDSPTENQLFGGIASMGLDSGLEGLYAVAGKAVAGLRDSIDSQPMVQSTNALRDELAYLFDRIEV